MSAESPMQDKVYEILTYGHKEHYKPNYYLISKDGDHFPGYEFYDQDEAIAFAKKHGFALDRESDHVQLQLTQEEISTIVHALKYINNRYCEQIGELVKLDRGYGHSELLDRARKYNALANKIEDNNIGQNG